MNLVNSPDYWWFFYPLLGWGIGLGSHGISIIASGRFGSEWEKKKIQEYMDKDN